MTGSVARLKVLDVSKTFAWSSWLGQILSDLGAEIVRVEHNDTPVTTSRDHEHDLTNSVCKTMALDFYLPADQLLLNSLINKADILITDSDPDNHTGIDLSYSTISQRNPQVVYCYLSGDMPRIFASNEPALQMIVSLYVSNILFTALFSRNTNGVGALLDLRQLEDKVLHAYEPGAVEYVDVYQYSNQLLFTHPKFCPYQVFETSDGYIIIAISQDAQFQRLCAAIKMPELARHIRCAKNSDRVTNRVWLVDILGSKIVEQTSARWFEKLQEHSIPCFNLDPVIEVSMDGVSHERNSHCEHQLDLFESDQTELSPSGNLPHLSHHAPRSLAAFLASELPVVNDNQQPLRV